MSKKLNKKQLNNLRLKHLPVREKEYIVTDQCFWEQNRPENYNPLDPKRTPHSITLVDPVTGSIALLRSGSIIKIVEPAG